ncbi:N-acetyltransferase family protein [Terrisporobacter sp.]
MNKKIRLATVEDLGRIQEIYKPYVEQEDVVINSEYRVPTMEELRERYEMITKDFPWLVCEIDGVVRAYAYAGKPFKREGYKWNVEVSVYTDVKYHGRGLAAILYECLLEILDMQGIYNVYACVLSINEKSIKFHEKYGFKVANIFENVVYKHNKWLNVVWMRKTLREFKDDVKDPISIENLNNKLINDIFNKNENKIKG